MRLRSYQNKAVITSISNLQNNDSALLVAPTGAGKTIMLSSIIHEYLGESKDARVLVIQHRKEILEQNMKKFIAVSEDAHSVGVFNAEAKHQDKTITFASEQTLKRHLNDSWGPFDLIVVDECHHIVASGYKRIIDHFKGINPRIKLLGVTATPERGDGNGLAYFFKEKFTHEIPIQLLMNDGYLVRPRTFVHDLGLNDEFKRLEAIYRKAPDTLLSQAENYINQPQYNQKVFDLWKEYAHDRSTVFFTSGVKHAHKLATLFQEQGISSRRIHGLMDNSEREQILDDYGKGNIQCLFNVAVLTEGWDAPKTSCVVLLRPSSHRSTWVQMIGRGLRPYEKKEDCIVLDFGTSTMKHGTLENEIRLEDRKRKKREDALVKDCSNCGRDNALNAQKCKFCGALFPKKEAVTDLGFSLAEKSIISFLEKKLRLIHNNKWALFDDLVDGCNVIGRKLKANRDAIIVERSPEDATLFAHDDVAIGFPTKLNKICDGSVGHLIRRANAQARRHSMEEGRGGRTISLISPRRITGRQQKELSRFCGGVGSRDMSVWTASLFLSVAKNKRNLTI